MVFGFQILSQKADAIKKQRNVLEQQLNVEIARIEERKVSRQQQLTQISRLEQAYEDFEADKARKQTALEEEIAKLKDMPFEEEKELWELIEVLTGEQQELSETVRGLQKDLQYATDNLTSLEGSLKRDQEKLAKLREADAESYLKDYDAYQEALDKIAALNGELKEIENRLGANKSERQKFHSDLTRLTSELEKHSDNCPTCQQPWPDQDARDEHVNQILDDIEKIQSKIEALDSVQKEIAWEAEKVSMAISEQKLVSLPVNEFFKSRDDAVRVGATIDGLVQNIIDLESQIEKGLNEKNDAQNKYDSANSQADAKNVEIVECKGASSFNSKSELSAALGKLETASASLTSLLNSDNPHTKTLEDARSHLVEEVDETVVNTLTKEIKHRKYLEKQLTNKSSDIRRDVMTKWLPRLNEEIQKNLEILDLPYNLVFNDDFSVTIVDKGLDSDFSLISSGEEERAILAVGMALRYVYEGIHGPINIFCVDERLDTGLDEAGSARAMSLLKKYADQEDKSILLISHKREMLDYVDRTMYVVKENRFSHIRV